MATLLDFLEDKQAQKDIGRGLLDAAKNGPNKKAPKK